MNRKQREAARARYDAQAKSRSAHSASATERRAKFALAAEHALTRAARTSAARVESGVRSVIAAKAPRLFDLDYGRAIARLVALPPVRPASEWSPRGKGRDTLFRSLASHWLARFPTPAIVWNAFHEDEKLVPLAVHVAEGGSLYELTRTRFPIPLTRRMCHDVLATSADHRLLDAIRRVQARAAGCDPRIFEAWRVTRSASWVGSREDEVFLAAVLAWFGRAPMLDPGEVAPLVDYIEHRRREDPAFTMKGRSALAMLRAMKEWHGNLTKERAVSGKVFLRSGFAPLDFPSSRREAGGGVVKERWSIAEILTARSLAEEGKRMGHCVYSYAWRIEKGDTSIWSVKMEDGLGETGRWHMVTLEVRNDLRRVVQARGRFNRAMTSREHQVVGQWAGMNNLKISLGSW